MNQIQNVRELDLEVLRKSMFLLQMYSQCRRPLIQRVYFHALDPLEVLAWALLRAVEDP